MKKNILVAFGLSLCFILLNSNTALATHAKGADISYECLGNNQYKIVASFYRDCEGIPEPASLSAQIIGTACGLTQNLSLLKDNAYTLILNGKPVQSGSEVSDLCLASQFQSKCNSANGQYPGVKIFFYTATVTIPPGCGNVTISISENARNAGINNLQNADIYNLFTFATLNTNFTGGCNNAPVFTSLPVPYYCIGQQYNFSHGAVDVDGDSLVYSMVQPLDGLNAPVPYAAGFSVANPLPTNGGFNFNTSTGTMNFIPTQVGNYTIAVRVDEYRNGVFVGSTIRDIQFVVINCSNAPPAVRDTLSNANVTGATVLGTSSLGVCPGTALTFSIPAKDKDGQTITVSSNIATSLPGASLTVTPLNNRPDSVLITVSWTPTGNDTGTRYITIVVSDGACPSEGKQILTYELTVNKGVTLGPDRVYCIGGGPITIQARGAQNYNWSPSKDFKFVNGSDSSTVIVVPTTSPLTYIVKGDLIGGCKDRDTITITTANTFSVVVTADDSTVCLNQSAQLTVTPTPSAEGPFTYSWKPAATVDNPTSGITKVRPTGTINYKVETRSKDGCLIKDSLTINIQGFGPKVRVTPSSNYVCPGTEVQLFTEIVPIQTGPNQNPADPCPNCDFPFPFPVVGTATTAGSTPTPFRSLWHDGRVQYLFRAAELFTSGLSAGVITDVQFFVTTKGSNVPFNNLQVKMGGTALTQLPVGQFITANMAQVYTGTYTTVANSWNSFTLNTPFNWDGQSNLIIEVCYDNSTFSGFDLVQFTTAFAGATNYADVDGSSGCTLAVDATTSQRPNTRFIFGKLPITSYNIQWSPSAGLSSDTALNPKVTVNENLVYSVVVSDSTCQGDTAVSLFLDPAVLIKASNDVQICNNEKAELIARVLNPVPQVCNPTYSLITTPFGFKTSGAKDPVPFPPAGTGNNRNASISLPFPFKFYCTDYSRFTLNENGFISFTTFTGAGSTNGAIPATGTPNNLIAGVWDDLNANGLSGGIGDITTFVTGTFPNRCFVIEWDNVLVVAQNQFVTFQIQLYESTQLIEVHLQPVAASGTKTIGIENLGGTAGVFPIGRNNANFATSLPEAWRFVPSLSGAAITTFEWSPATGLNETLNDTVYASPPSNTQYVVTGYFTNGCKTYDTVNVTIGSFPYTISATKLNLCPNETTQLTFAGAASSIAWTPNATLSAPTALTTTASPQNTTTYTATAFDATGCRVIDSITIIVKTNGSVTLGRDTTICYSSNLTLSPSGGPYSSYQWNPGGQSTAAITVNQTGSYFVVLSDGQCTFTSDTLRLNVVNAINLVAYRDTGICVGDSVQLESQTGFSNYVWNTGAQTTNILVNTPGIFSYSATDQNSCVQRSDTIEVKVKQKPIITLTSNPEPFCEGSFTTLNAGSLQGIVYEWSKAGENIFTKGNTYNATTAGTYQVAASDSGCRSFGTITVSTIPAPTVTLGQDTQTCDCGTTILLAPTVNGNAASYRWNTGATTETINVDSSGNYTVTVTSSNRCEVVASVNATFYCLKVKTKAEKYALLSGQQTTIYVDSLSYASDFEYLWQPPTFLEDTALQNVRAKPDSTITYLVRVTDTKNGCVGFDTITLTILPPGLYVFPNSFTPNADGTNDYFKPYFPTGSTASFGSLRIYNQWGQLVYECISCDFTVANSGWDGKLNGIDQPNGTYYYSAQVLTPNANNPNVNDSFIANGVLTLIK